MERVVIITGCSSSLGEKLAKKFIDEGDFVYGIAKDEINIFNLKYIPCDITNEDMCRLVVDKILKEKGKIDILLNNATIGTNGPIEFTDKKDIKKMLEVNFLGAINMSKAVLPVYKKQKYGKIINFGTLTSLVFSPYESIFCTIKSAILEFTKHLRFELKRFNVESCCVIYNTKSLFDEEKNLQLKNSEYKETYDNLIKAQSLKKPIKLEQYAKAIYSLAIRKKLPLKKVIGFKNNLNNFGNKFIPLKLKFYLENKKYLNKVDKKVSETSENEKTKKTTE